MGTSALDIDIAVLQLLVSWMRDASTMQAEARALEHGKVDEAIRWADYLCVAPLRQFLQHRILKDRIHQAEESRRNGEASELDALGTLTAFTRSGRSFTVLKGLCSADIKAVNDAAILLDLQALRLGSEFPRALVVARKGVSVDLKALAAEHAPRVARSSKHGSGGRRRRNANVKR